MPTPTFSVVIPTYNRERVLARAIDSVLRQSLADWELIVVDDGSTDETAALVASFDDARIRYLFQENQGRSAARNYGAGQATGEYLVFLDSDDESRPQWLETLARAFFETGCDIVHCGADCVDADGNVSGCRLPQRCGPAFGNRRLSFFPGSFALKRQVFQALGGYVVGLEMCENTELHLRLAEQACPHGWRFHSLDAVLVRYHCYGQTIVDNPAGMPPTVDFLLENHRRAFAADPKTTACYCRIAGVCSARIGNLRTARRFLRSAITASPWQWRDYARLLVACFPCLSRIVWPNYAAIAGKA